MLILREGISCFGSHFGYLYATKHKAQNFITKTKSEKTQNKENTDRYSKEITVIINLTGIIIVLIE